VYAVFHLGALMALFQTAVLFTDARIAGFSVCHVI